MEDFYSTISGEDFEKLRQLLLKIAATLYETDLLDNADMKLIFKVSDKTLYRWRKKEHLFYIKVGGKFYYPRKVLYETLYQRLLTRYPSKDLPKLF